jgi:hypothetical protein
MFVGGVEVEVETKTNRHTSYPTVTKEMFVCGVEVEVETKTQPSHPISNGHKEMFEVELKLKFKVTYSLQTLD